MCAGKCTGRVSKAENSTDRACWQCYRCNLLYLPVYDRVYLYRRGKQIPWIWSRHSPIELAENIPQLLIAGGTDTPTKEETDRFSLELHVDETTAPTFVWHTVTDKTVPIQNTLFLVNALVENGVPCEAHIYPKGVHGLSLCNTETWSKNPSMLAPHEETWMALAIKWINDMFW